MSSESAPLPTGARGRPAGSRSRSYGSLVQSSLSPVRHRWIEHDVQPGETLQGLALKYGVSMEQIKRANRLYTNDHIFLRKSISIPLPADFDTFSHGVSADEQTDELYSNEHREYQGKQSNLDSKKEKDQVRLPDGPELSPMDFLKRMDAQISQSKMAAIKKICEGKLPFACPEDSHLRGTPVHSAAGNTNAASSITNQRAMLGAVPLTITKRTKVLRHQEDEIFQL